MICRARLAAQFAVAVVVGCVARAAEVAPGPHDRAHLIVVKAAEWADGNGPVKTAENLAATFDKAVVPVTGPVTARIAARHAGDYVLWVRVGQAAGKQTPLAVQVAQGASTPLDGRANHGTGKVGAGGPEGYRDYREKAPLNNARGVIGDPELTQRGGLPERKVGGGDKGADDLADDLLGEMRAGTGENWVNTARVDKVTKESPFYWWKVGTVRLAKGEYDLRVRPDGPVSAAAPPLIDAAILTTYDKLVYPYAGDINAPRASYIRFRIGALPKDGLEISADINTHQIPYLRTPRFNLNPSGISVKKAERHTAAGFTRWYCLQDVERAPGLNGQEVTLHLMDPAAVAAQGAKGATQFAVFPHQDAVVRTIAWDEPDGLIISMQSDFQKNSHQLRTIRDHAREHYDLALAAADNQIHPLTRGGELSFTNSWGAALGSDYDYLVKTMRLLGFNSVGIRNPLKSRANYGGLTSEGTSWGSTFLPYDEDKAREHYRAYYRDAFKGADPALWKGVNVFQICDEPGEAYREEMTAPLWRFERETAGGGGRWVDRSGGSDLHTRKVDLANCVVEGTITKMAGWVGFRVGIDDAQSPKNYAYWHVGRVAPNNMPENLAVGKVGPGAAARPTYILRPSAAVGEGATPFKIICEGTRAALYLNGQLVHEHKDLPPTGGVGITGPPKAVNALMIRPIGKKEHLSGELADGGGLGAAKAPAEELDDADKTPPPVAKPLQQFVEQEWVQAGGVPEAHAGFRKWLAARGMTPAFFGKKSWDDVRMLTVRELVTSGDDARAYYWGRRYSGFLTARMFAIAAQAVRDVAPNKEMVSFVGLSGHSLNFPSEMPVDMFEMGNQGYPLMPGVSDWMSYGGWRWDSHQSVAYSVAPFNAGARRWAADGAAAAPASYPMMHCVYPSVIRAYTMLASQVKFISYFAFGPYYAVPVDHWSESPESYRATSLTGNRAAKVDDVLSAARVRPSRVAMLYALSTEYWAPHAAFNDRRAAFIGMSHEYFQPELVTEDQVAAGVLKHYDALYVMDSHVSAAAQAKIGEWAKAGGLLWASASALSRDEYDQPLDALAALGGLKRTFAPVVAPAKGAKTAQAGPVVRAVEGEAAFRPHTVATADLPTAVSCEGGRVRAKYEDGMPAWVEHAVDRGRLVYIAHRAGLTYTSKAARPAGYADLWADTGRAALVRPLIEAKVGRELVLSQPTVMASPMSTPDGTVVVLYNMRPAPCTGLVLELNEPAKPLSVQAFRGFDLVDVPYEYRDGRAVIALGELDGGQMVLVRRKAAPPDAREDETRARTVGQLDSKDADALSAGAWFAGWHPEWKLAERLVPLLTHPRWEVRRSAAEALGRLKHAPAAAALASAMRVEKDSNALGDQILALGRLREPGTSRLARELLAHDSPLVRRMAVRATAAGDLAAQQDLWPIAVAALADADLRVRAEGITLATRLDPTKAAAMACAAFNSTDVRATQDRPNWVTAVAGNDAALAEYAKGGLPGGDELLLALAAARPHPELAKAVAARAVELDQAWPHKVAAAAIRQADKGLARRIFELREKLRPETAAYAPYALERAYGAELGGIVDDWAKWLNQR